MTRRYGNLHPLNRRFILNLVGSLRRQEIEPRKVGLGYLVLGGLTALLPLVSLAVPASPGGELPPSFEAVRPFFERSGSVTAIQAGLGLLALGSSLAFLRGHRGSRVGLDAFTIAFGAWALFFGQLWLRTVWSMTVAPEGPVFVKVFGVAMMAGGAFVFGTFVLLAAFALRYLHGPRVRAHLSGPASRANPLVR